MSTANPSYKPSEGKREEFRKYLEKNGVMDALTRVLVNLYEEAEKPEDALEYIRDKLALLAGLETNKQLQMKLADAEDRIKELESQLQSGEGEGDPNVIPVGSMSQQPTTENVPEEVRQSSDFPPPEDNPNPEENPDADQ